MARKQQFMRYLSLRTDVDHVLYVEPPINLWFIILNLPALMRDAEKRERLWRALLFKTKPLSEKLRVFTPLTLIPFAYRYRWIYDFNARLTAMVVKLKAKCMPPDRTVLWMYHPFDTFHLRAFGHAALTVFDWAEDWSKYFIEYTQRERDKVRIAEELMVRKAGLVMTTSQSLLERALKINPRSCQVLDGVSTELFGEILRTPPEMERIKSPIIGYVGTITERFDVDLVRAISQEFAHGSIVIIGQVHKKRVDVSPLLEIKNVHFTGVKPYAELAGYLTHFDVCILPYKRDSFSWPPTKIFDYLASGKPIVSVSFPEADKFSGHVMFADTSKEFINLIKEALANENAIKKSGRLAMAAENSWQARADEIMNLVRTATMESEQNHEKNSFYSTPSAG